MVAGGATNFDLGAGNENEKTWFKKVAFWSQIIDQEMDFDFVPTLYSLKPIWLWYWRMGIDPTF
jgi:hypothetical protein